MKKEGRLSFRWIKVDQSILIHQPAQNLLPCIPLPSLMPPGRRADQKTLARMSIIIIQMELTPRQPQVQGGRDSPKKRIGTGKDLTAGGDFCGTVVAVPFFVGDRTPAGAGCVFKVEHR